MQQEDLSLDEHEWLQVFRDAEEEKTIDRDEYQLLYTNALQDNPWSIELYKKYFSFLESKSTIDGRDEIQRLYQTAVDNTMYHVSQSHEIWDPYIEKKIEDLENDTVTQGSIHTLFLQRLKVPHLTISNTFQQYSSFITKFDNDNYEQHLLSCNPVYQKSKQVVLEIENWEHDLDSHVHDSEYYNQYLIELLRKPVKAHGRTNMIIGLYRRILTKFPLNAPMWHDFYVFLANDRSNLNNERLMYAVQQGLRFCRSDADLWATNIRLTGRITENQSSVWEVLEEGLHACKTSEAYTKLFAMSYYAVREAAANDFEQEYVLIAGLDRIKERKMLDVDSLLTQLLIDCRTRLSRIDEARKLWKDLIKIQNDKAIFWLRYFQWELSQGNIGGARALIKSACLQTKDNPPLIYETATTFELSHGHSNDYDSTLYLLGKAYRAYVDSTGLVSTPHVQNGTLEDPPERPDTQEAPQQLKRKADDHEASQIGKKAKMRSESPVYQRNRENTTVIVQGLTPSATKESLANFFRDCGGIKSIKIDQVEGQNDISALVEFTDNSDAAAALTKTFKDFEGRQIIVESAQDTVLFVTNWPPLFTAQELRSLFSPYGRVLDIRMPSLMYDQHRRFAYIQMASAKEAKTALDNLNGQDLGDECIMSVGISNPAAKQTRHTAATRAREIVVKNISFKADESDITDYFAQYGAVDSVRLPRTISKKHHNGVAFIVFKEPESAQKALSTSKALLMNRELVMEMSQPRARHTHPGSSAESRTRRDSDVAPDFSQIKAKTLGILDLPDTISEAQLRKVLEPHGALRKVTLRPDHSGAIVEYENSADAGKASLALQGQSLGGALITVGTYEDLMQQPSSQVKDGPSIIKPSMAPRKVKQSKKKPGPKKSNEQTHVHASSSTIGFASSDDIKASGQARNQDYFRDLLQKNKNEETDVKQKQDSND